MKGTWNLVEIAGKPADVYELAGAARPRFGVIHLHGVGKESLRGNDAFTRWFDTQQMVCVCPSGGLSWWADRICAEFDPHITAEKYVVEKVLPYFNERWGLLPRSVGLHGISMGGQGALRIGFRYPQLFPVVAGISSAIEYHEYYGMGYSMDDMYDSKEQCRQDTVPMHIHPSHYPPHIFFCVDPDDTAWFRGNDRLHEKLNALGVSHQCDLTTRAGGHSWDYFNQCAARVQAFVLAGLEQESRRLL